jgi:hypothetical protein
MLSTSSRKADDCATVERRLARALERNDRDGARRIYYTQVLPNPGFDRREAVRLSFRTGAVDEGDEHLAGRADL